MDGNSSNDIQQANSPVNQAIPTSPNVIQTPAPNVQPPQPGFQQPAGFPVANVITASTNEGNQNVNEKESKLKYVAYFLLGLVLSVLGLLIGVILIVVKEKQGKMRKLIPLLLGVTMSVVVWFVIAGGITFEGTTTTSSINNSQPRSVEEQEMVKDLSSLYPNLTFKISYGEHKPPLTIGDTTISTFVTVELSSNENVTPEQIAGVGKQVCTTLSRLQLSVSTVEVQNVSKKSAISSSSRGIGGTCEEYNSGKILQTLQSM